MLSISCCVAIYANIFLVHVAQQAAATGSAGGGNSRSLHAVAEIGTSMFESKTIPCDPAVVGSVAACFKSGSPATNNRDYPFPSPIISYGNGEKASNHSTNDDAP